MAGEHGHGQQANAARKNDEGHIIPCKIFRPPRIKNNHKIFKFENPILHFLENL